MPKFTKGGFHLDSDSVKYSTVSKEAKSKSKAKEISEFVERFLAYRFRNQNEGLVETNREKLRGLGTLDSSEMIGLMNRFNRETIAQFPFPVEEIFPEIQKQAGMNIISKYPLRTFVASVLVGFIAFTLPLVGMMIFEAVTGGVAMSAILPFLPFLAAFGPLGAAVAFAGLISAAALVIFGATAAITAAATEKKIEVVDVVDREGEFAPSQFTPQFKGLESDDDATPPPHHHHHTFRDTYKGTTTYLNTVASTEHLQQDQPPSAIAANS